MWRGEERRDGEAFALRLRGVQRGKEEDEGGRTGRGGKKDKGSDHDGEGRMREGVRMGEADDFRREPRSSHGVS